MITVLTNTIRQRSPITSRLIRLGPPVQMIVDQLVRREPATKILFIFKIYKKTFSIQEF